MTEIVLIHSGLANGKQYKELELNENTKIPVPHCWNKLEQDIFWDSYNAARRINAKASCDNDIKLSVEYTYTEICDIIGYNRSKESILNILKQLTKVDIQINSPRFIGTTVIIQAAGYANDQTKYAITFGERFMQYILNIKKEREGYILSKKEELLSPGTLCQYTNKLYISLKEWLNLPDYKTREYTLIDLRYLLGIPDDRYKDFRKFKRDVLENIKKDLDNDPTKVITFTYEAIRVGRQVGKIKFTITRKRKKTIEEAQLEKIIAEIESEVAATTTEEPPDSPFRKIADKAISDREASLFTDDELDKLEQ